MPTPATAKKMPAPPSDSMLGQREKNKIDKLRRIKAAAQELFLSKGFDDTTTREIALRAGVGMGTVFIYADNKRDLVFLVANDELADATAKAEASVRDEASCLQNLLTVFRHHYEFFGRQPELSRLMLREMTFYDTGRQADRFQATRERVIRLVGSIMSSRTGMRDDSNIRGRDLHRMGRVLHLSSRAAPLAHDQGPRPQHRHGRT